MRKLTDYISRRANAVDASGIRKVFDLAAKMKTSVPAVRTNPLLQFSQHFVNKLVVQPRRYKKYVTEVFDEQE